jgi:hypothetical protein
MLELRRCDMGASVSEVGRRVAVVDPLAHSCRQIGDLIDALSHSVFEILEEPWSGWDDWEEWGDYDERRIVIALAGYEAERRVVDFEDLGIGGVVDGDWYEAAGHTGFIPLYEARARVLVARHWPEVEAVAAELIRGGTLSGEDVRHIIALVTVTQTVTRRTASATEKAV